jgi:hypothetical protein
MATRRSVEEIERLLEGYRQSGLSRVEYCRQQGIRTTTLDYYLHRRRRNTIRFARVTVTPQPVEPASFFALALRNGRRIESAWNFRDADLARLIRVAEAE